MREPSSTQFLVRMCRFLTPLPQSPLVISPLCTWRTGSALASCSLYTNVVLHNRFLAQVLAASLGVVSLWAEFFSFWGSGGATCERLPLRHVDTM